MKNLNDDLSRAEVYIARRSTFGRFLAAQSLLGQLSVRACFRQAHRFGKIASTCKGMQLADNDRSSAIGTKSSFSVLDFQSIDEAARGIGQKWFPYNKGGAFRNGTATYEYVVNWENDGRSCMQYATQL